MSVKDMTIEEKKEALYRFCSNQEKCSSCPLEYLGWCANQYFESFTGSQIYEAYKVAFGCKEEINHPDRYKSGKFECIDVMLDVFGADAVKHFCILNAFKYLWRAEKKNGIQDVQKAVWYLNKFIELGGEENKT